MEREWGGEDINNLIEDKLVKETKQKKDITAKEYGIRLKGSNVTEMVAIFQKAFPEAIFDKKDMSIRFPNPKDSKNPKNFTDLMAKHILYPNQIVYFDTIKDDPKTTFDSFFTGKVDVGDFENISASEYSVTDADIIFMRAVLIHYIVERFCLDDYEKNKGLYAKFNKGVSFHKRGLSAETEYMKKEFPNNEVYLEREHAKGQDKIYYYGPSLLINAETTGNQTKTTVVFSHE